MKLTVNGHEIEGTATELSDLLKLLETTGPDNLYYSESRNTFVKISDMNGIHARNALLKIYRDWAASLSALDNTGLFNALKSGPTEPVFLNLLKRFYESEID